MTGLTDLKTLEKRAFRRFYEDGIFDIFLGVMMGTMAIGAVVTDRSGSEATGMLVMLAVAFGAVVLLTTVRRRLLTSRLGEFIPGPARKRRISLTRFALLGSLAVGVVLFGFIAAGDVSIVSLEVLMPAVWFVNSVAVLGAMAYFLDVPRFYLYGFLFGLAMPLMIWPDVVWDYRVAPWIAFGAPALVIVIVGIFKLTGFLRDYPVRTPAESTHD